MFFYYIGISLSLITNLETTAGWRHTIAVVMNTLKTEKYLLLLRLLLKNTISGYGFKSQAGSRYQVHNIIKGLSRTLVLTNKLKMWWARGYLIQTLEMVMLTLN